MRIAAREFTEARQARNVARAAFDQRVAQIRSDIETRGVGGRIADKLSGDAREALDEGLAVAAESKGIIAAIAAALTLWFMRHPIMEWVAEALDRTEYQDQDWEDDID